jgi:predicted transcriptional regulator
MSDLLDSKTSATAVADATAIRLMRTVRRMPQAELAQLSGISQIKISGLENGRYRPTAAEWQKLWGALSTGE